MSILDSPERLGLRYGSQDGNWKTVAKFIKHSAVLPTVWFPDSNVAILPAAESIWDALRASAKVALRKPIAVLSDIVDSELHEWLRDPWKQMNRANLIRYARERNEWLHVFRIGKEKPAELAIYGYLGLLSARRTLALESEDGKTLLGTDVSEKSRTMDRISQTIGQRAVQLAKKGRESVAQKGMVNVCDEMHCLMVIFYALVNRIDCVLLTADSDHLEIFYKAQWLIDTHYRAWLVAKLINTGKYKPCTQQLTQTDGYFCSPVTLYPRKSHQLRDILPHSYQSVKVSVLHVSPQNVIHKMTFAFDTQMLEMLAVRGSTDGRCTDLLDEMNVHVHLGPLCDAKDELVMGVGKDTTHRFTINGVERNLARLDLEHALNCRETHARV